MKIGFLAKYFIALLVASSVGFIVLAKLFEAGPSDSGNYASLAVLLVCLAIVVYAAWRTAKENSFLKTVLIGGVFVSASFVVFVVFMRTIGDWLRGLPLSWEALFSSQLFGCQEPFLINAPWVCGEFLRALFDGFVIGAILFGVVKLIRLVLGGKKND